MKSISTVLLAVSLLVVCGCGDQKPASPQSSPQIQATGSITPNPTASVSATPSPTATAPATATATPKATSSAIATVTPIPSASPAPAQTTVPFDRKKAFELLENASELKDVYDEKSYTKSELYEYFKPYYTNAYVDKTILKNMKQVGDKWTIAYPNSELMEGSYYETNFTDQTKFEQAGDTIIITNQLDGGLSAAHEEKISLVQTKDGWKIDSLEWKELK